MRTLSVVTLLAALVVLNYYPVFLGKVPLPTDLIIQFPTFLQYHSPSTLNRHHAELGDTVMQFYPWRAFAGETIRSGKLPLWNSGLLAGTPFQAEPQSALFYPMNWIFVILPAPISWSISLMLKVFLAGLFMTLFLAEIGCSRSGSIAGGIAFAFGGFMTVWTGWPQTDTALWLPLICLFGRRNLRPSFRNSILFALVLAMPILAGHPEVGAYVLFTGAAYAVYGIACEHSPMWKRQLLWLAVAVTLCAGVAAVQVLPSIEWLGQLFRQLKTNWPTLPLKDAIALFSRDLSLSPNSAGVPIPIGAVYCGALCLVAATVSMFHRNKKDTAFFAVVLLVAFCSAYGIPPIINLYNATPLFSGLKKEDALLLVDFALAVLAALGVSVIEEVRWNEATIRTRVSLAGTVIVATLILHSTTARLSKMTMPGVDVLRSPRSFRFLLVISVLLILLRFAQFLSRRQWGVLACGLLALDLLTYSHGYLPFNPPGMIFPKAGVFDFLSRQSQPFRIVGVDGASMLNIEPVYGLSSAAGNDFVMMRLFRVAVGLKDERWDHVIFTAKGIVNTRNRVLDLLNVKYVIATRFNESLELMQSEPQRFREAWTDGAVTVFENLHVLPRVFLVPQQNIEIISDEMAQWARVRDSGFDPANAVILPRVLNPNKHEMSVYESGNGAMSVTRYDEGSNWIRVRAKADVPSILVLSQVYYPGWRVLVDGKESSILPADYAFTGIQLESGSHDVEFRFRPRPFVVGAGLSVFSLLFMALAVLLRRA